MIKASLESTLGRMTLSIRRTEPTDYEALYQIFTRPKAVWGTFELPFPSLEAWRKRGLGHRLIDNMYYLFNEML